MDTKDSIEKLAREIILENKIEVNYLCKEFLLTQQDILKAWVVWDSGINEYGNEIYNSHAMRVAMHLHNYIPNNWHDKRQGIVIDLLSKIQPQSIVEIGFGTPQRYVTDYVLKNKKHLDLLDFDKESISFAEVFLNSKSDKWKKFIVLRKYDMNSQERIGRFDCYILQDSIEHANDPGGYLDKMVSEAPSCSHFIFSLPIEVDKLVPEHNIFWKDKEDAMSWLKKGGLVVQSYHEIKMDGTLDLFAKYLHPDYMEVVIYSIKP